MRRGNPGKLKFFNDDDSRTGTSAAILIRNIRPSRLRDDGIMLAESEFLANFSMDCDGYRVRPRVLVMIQCQLNQLQSKALQQKRRIERAMAGSPVLK